MKLIIAIVNSDDSSSVQGALTEGGYFVTKLSTTGGFLKKGNTTFFVGTNDDKVEDCISIIKAHSIMVDVLVGGATVFVLNIDQFEKF